MKGYFLLAIIIQDFIGKWKGTLEWFRTGNPEPQKVNMELYILPSKDTASQYSWHLIYGSVSADSRPYLLKPVDSAKGHWRIDELNGIILDQYWVGSRFSGSFTVGNSTIVNTYYIENGQIVVEFISYAAKPVATTGKGNEDSPFVDSYGVKSFQRAVLTKQ
jgi:hypothetical protein